jgi:hypothetical protein
LRHLPDDALVDDVEFAIRSRTRDRSRIPDVVARSKQCYLGADGSHDAGGIPTEHLRRSGLGIQRLANFRIDRVHRDRADLDEHITRLQLRLRKFDVDQRRWIIDGQCSTVADSFHQLTFSWKKRVTNVAARTVRVTLHFGDREIIRMSLLFS